VVDSPSKIAAADGVDSADYNQALSARRPPVVREALLAMTSAARLRR
jgi:outer membrane protein OmpA-like peptidoglycan-associated protein